MGNFEHNPKMISHRHKFIFIHIPRTAGTSIEKVLWDDSCTLLPNEWDISRFADTPLNHLTLQQVYDHGFLSDSNFERYFSFCFVRNPWDRAVSEVFYLQAINYLQGHDTNQALRRICEIDNAGNHVRPQYDFVARGAGAGIDFIGRFENLQNDFDRVCDILGIPRRQLPVTNTLNRNPHWQYFDAQTRRLVTDKYRRDVEAFGYEFV